MMTTLGLSWWGSSIGSDVLTFTVGPDSQASRFETEGLGAFIRGDAAAPGEPVPLEID